MKSILGGTAGGYTSCNTTCDDGRTIEITECNGTCTATDGVKVVCSGATSTLTKYCNKNENSWSITE